MTSEAKGTSVVETIELLRNMLVSDIERQGPSHSFMVRAGLLLDILDLAVAAPDMAEALTMAKDFLLNHRDNEAAERCVLMAISAALAKASQS